MSGGFCPNLYNYRVFFFFFVPVIGGDIENTLLIVNRDFISREAHLVSWLNSLNYNWETR